MWWNFWWSICKAYFFMKKFLDVLYEKNQLSWSFNIVLSQSVSRIQEKIKENVNFNCLKILYSPLYNMLFFSDRTFFITINCIFGWIRIHFSVLTIMFVPKASWFLIYLNYFTIKQRSFNHIFHKTHKWIHLKSFCNVFRFILVLVQIILE